MSFIGESDVGIQAVSHSRMKTYESCPRKAKYKYIDKLKEPSNAAMDRGLQVHSNLEHWLLKRTGKEYEGDPVLPREPVYSLIIEDIDGYMKGDPKYVMEAEKQVAFNKNWDVVGWFDTECWMRVVFDFIGSSPCGTHMVLGDYKTGKVYDDHDKQADLYAVAGYKMGARAVDVKFYYTDAGIVQPYTYDTDELEALVAEVEARADVVTSDRVFATNPSWRCKWCHFRRENGGPCAH